MTSIHFPGETAKAVLTDILAVLNTPENIQKIAEAKENSGNEMTKMFQLAFPIVVQIIMDVIQKYGFPEGREGILEYERRLKPLKRGCPKLAKLYNQIRSYYFPSLISPAGDPL